LDEDGEGRRGWKRGEGRVNPGNLQKSVDSPEKEVEDSGMLTVPTVHVTVTSTSELVAQLALHFTEPSGVGEVTQGPLPTLVLEEDTPCLLSFNFHNQHINRLKMNYKRYSISLT
jgi:hypothetical protein